ncbi:putative mucoidy inhibitor-like protein [Paramyrothecium foliicola]|nr:putative mucoidy inhibitor-like protein [Paramyrothecium foliicola]
MDSSLERIKYHIRDLPTQSVTLFPSRAQITRELKDVPLKPGINEVVIVGLTPTVDEHSIKVQGSGSTARFAGIAVELLPNRELFHDVYPESDEDDEEQKNDRKKLDNRNEEEEKLKQSIEAVQEKLTLLRDKQRRFEDLKASAVMRLNFLDTFGQSLGGKDSKVSIKDGLETYHEERQKVFDNHMDATVRERHVAKEISQAEAEQQELRANLDELETNKAKAEKKSAKVMQKKQQVERLRKAESRREKERIRKQREQFWPRSCYTVRITLDASNLTPPSSRRTSLAGDLIKPGALEGKPSGDAINVCNIVLSYVTSSAFWSPSYDLALSTMTNTAQLCFDASLTNMTSEAWYNCKITLSNSQTTLSSMGDVIPNLKPWHIKLAGKQFMPASDSATAFQDILLSKEEQAEKKGWTLSQNAWATKPRAHLFGVPEIAPTAFKSLFPPRPQGQAPIGTGLFGNNAQQAPPPSAPTGSFGGGLFGSAPQAPPVASDPAASRAGGLFGSAGQNLRGGANMAPTSSGLFGSASTQNSTTGGLFGMRSNSVQIESSGANAAFGSVFARSNNSDEKSGNKERDASPATSILEPKLELSFQQSSFEETGLTTTYEIPGAKTLKPSPTASKLRVAQVSFANVTFSRTVVAKYKPAAYLEAKLLNSGEVTLLKGPTNITLDNTYIGRSTLPRCSIGNTFALSLGIDPAIKVSYSKPEVRRSTGGIFSKENSSLHTRILTLSNNRAAAAEPVQITVLDQIPVSEDEKLRVSAVQPSGLNVGGSAVATGQAGRDGDKNWGKATAVLKKDGEVAWDVTLNASHSARLTLEYEVIVPIGEHATQRHKRVPIYTINILRFALFHLSPAWTAIAQQLDPPERQNSTFINPILPGFHPDPSCIFVKDDHFADNFFCVSSSFLAFLDLPIFASQDLREWTVISNVLNRPSQYSDFGTWNKDQTEGV